MTTDAVREKYKRFTLFEPEDSREEKKEKDTRCEYAKQLQVCLNEVSQKALSRPTRFSINEGYLICLIKFMEWRAAVPKRHRNQMSEHGHHCIWHTFEETYLRLKRVELMLPDTIFLLPDLSSVSFVPETFVRE